MSVLDPTIGRLVKEAMDISRRTKRKPHDIATELIARDWKKLTAETTRLLLARGLGTFINNTEHIISQGKNSLVKPSPVLQPKRKLTKQAREKLAEALADGLKEALDVFAPDYLGRLSLAPDGKKPLYEFTRPEFCWAKECAEAQVHGWGQKVSFFDRAIATLKNDTECLADQPEETLYNLAQAAYAAWMKEELDAAE